MKRLKNAEKVRSRINCLHIAKPKNLNYILEWKKITSVFNTSAGGPFALTIIGLTGLQRLNRVWIYLLIINIRCYNLYNITQKRGPWVYGLSLQIRVWGACGHLTYVSEIRVWVYVYMCLDVLRICSNLHSGESCCSLQSLFPPAPTLLSPWLL